MEDLNSRLHGNEERNSELTSEKLTHKRADTKMWNTRKTLREIKHIVRRNWNSIIRIPKGKLKYILWLLT